MKKDKFKLKDAPVNEKSKRTPEFFLIQEAVARTVREYGKTLKKLARDG